MIGLTDPQYPRIATPCSDLNSESIYTPADMLLLSDEEEDILNVGDEDDENEDLALLKTPIWRQVRFFSQDTDSG